MKAHIKALLDQALEQLKCESVVPTDVEPDATVERTRDRAHGDFASNLALVLARSARQRPRDLAERLVQALPVSPQIDRVEVAGPGFINFHLAPAAYHMMLAGILGQGEAWGRSDAGRGRKVQVEFVSANPTGPLHVGHGRGAAIGDSLARLLETSGWQVTREFYYNDAGQQIQNLALSVQARVKELARVDWPFPEDGYRGAYIRDIAARYRDEHPADPRGEDLESIRRFAVAALRAEQDLDLRAFDVRFDSYFLESSLYTDGRVEETVRTLLANGHAYEQDGALWLRTTEFGDDKDRVMRKADGSYTYFVPDVAYHVTKWQRGFERVINEQGADHHSTVIRVRAGLQALDLGIPKGWPEYVLHQMVTVMRGGEEVRISKRAGSYVTLRELIDEVGCDATRYFLNARKPDSQLVFDIDLARSQSNDNPVYYIQYAHARICSVFNQLAERGLAWDQSGGVQSLALLCEHHEDALMVTLARYPDVVEAATRNSEPHLVAQYLRDLAYAFHTYYNSHQFLVDEAPLRNARLTLIAATRQVIRNGLWLLGVSAPEAM